MAKASAVAAVVALPTVLLAFFYGQSRIFLVMARDGFLPTALARISPRRGTPVRITLITAILVAIIAGEGTPAEVVQSRGLTVVSDDSALIAAIDEALAAQPDVLEKIREGKVQAAGAVIGAVMKAMQGKADAARVRELVLERAGS